MAPRKSHLILSALIGLGSFARAAEVADRSAGSSTTAEVPSGRLMSSDAEKLFSGPIPRLSRVDDRYKRPVKALCRVKWKQFRNTPVSPRPIRANLATIQANARRFKISPNKINRTLAVFLKNQNELPNQRFVSLIDFDKSSREKRLFTIDLQSGKIESFFVAAGKGSDPRHTGVASQFSNKKDTLASSLGCFVGAGRYNGSFGRDTLMLHGIEKTNDNACDREIVMHPANYANAGGRSWGCPAILKDDLPKVFDRVGGGGLICSLRDGPVSEAPVIERPKRKAGKARHHRARSYRHYRRSYASY